MKSSFQASKRSFNLTSFLCVGPIKPLLLIIFGVEMRSLQKWTTDVATIHEKETSFKETIFTLFHVNPYLLI